jgi:thiamine-monophosphate kinase
MAAEPLAAVATVALPKGFAREDAEAIYAGMRQVADEQACPLVGGDVGSWSGPLAVTVTAFARPGPSGPILRSGARPGDAVCVTGSLGGAWRTRRHLTFTPRIAEARALAARHDIHAMIDLSDGLSTDLGHVCAASGTGADVIAQAVPIHPDARAAEDPLAAALGDGEDYELLFALPPDEAGRLIESQPLGVPVARVGTIVEGGELVLVRPDGRCDPLDPTGWEHRT